ncbi:MAG: hypothetical protein M1831_005235 [Alyxoria varia]|nr:MAG: hypothetical protein M1831_005235 [Alyxoria varia]
MSLLRNRLFRRGVDSVHDIVHNAKQGKNPLENLKEDRSNLQSGVERQSRDANQNGRKGFGTLFMDEIRNQLKRGPPNK